MDFPKTFLRMSLVLTLRNIKNNPICCSLSEVVRVQTDISNFVLDFVKKVDFSLRNLEKQTKHHYLNQTPLYFVLPRLLLASRLVASPVVIVRRAKTVSNSECY